MRQRALVVPDKSERVHHFHRSTLIALGELAGAAGLAHPGEFRPTHILKRLSPSAVQSFAEVYPRLAAGELLTGGGNEHYARHWAVADPGSFAAREVVRPAA
jgi:hypothetical protein